MLDITRSVELTRLAIVLGIVVGMVIYQRTGLTLGGVIMPGFFAVYITRPQHLFATLFIAVITFMFVRKFLLRRKIFYGRTLMEIEILTGVILMLIWTGIMGLLAQWNDTFYLFISMGVVLPGIISHDMARQGIKRTLVTSLLGGLVVYLLVSLIGYFQELVPHVIAPLPFYHTHAERYAYPVSMLPVAVVGSILLGIFVLKRFQLHTIGYASTAYFALLVFRPLDLGLLIVCAVLTYLVVVHWVKRIALVFGRVKLGTMVLVGVVISWGLELLITYLSQGMLTPWIGVRTMVPLLVALIANEIERQGWMKTTIATTASMGAILVFIQGVLLFLNFIEPV